MVDKYVSVGLHSYHIVMVTAKGNKPANICDH